MTEIWLVIMIVNFYRFPTFYKISTPENRWNYGFLCSGCFLKNIFFLYHWDVFTILLNIHEGRFFKNCQRLLVVHFLAFFYWCFYVEIVNDYQPVTGFTYIYILDVWQGLKYTFVAYQFHAGFTVLAITASKLRIRCFSCPSFSP